MTITYHFGRWRSYTFFNLVLLLFSFVLLMYPFIHSNLPISHRPTHLTLSTSRRPDLPASRLLHVSPSRSPSLFTSRPPALPLLAAIGRTRQGCRPPARCNTSSCCPRSPPAALPDTQLFCFTDIFYSASVRKTTPNQQEYEDVDVRITKGNVCMPLHLVH